MKFALSMIYYVSSDSYKPFTTVCLTVIYLHIYKKFSLVY